MVNFTTKTPSQWINPSGEGYVKIIGFLNIQDNLGHLFQDNLGNLIGTNNLQSFTKYATLWAGTGA